MASGETFYRSEDDDQIKAVIDGSMRAIRPETMYPGDAVFISPRKVIVDTDGALYVDGGGILEEFGVYESASDELPVSSKEGFVLLASVCTDPGLKTGLIADIRNATRGSLYETRAPIGDPDSEAYRKADFRPLRIDGIYMRGSSQSGLPGQYVGNPDYRATALELAGNIDQMMAKAEYADNIADKAVAEGTTDSAVASRGILQAIRGGIFRPRSGR